MEKKTPIKVIRISQSSGWVVIASDTNKVMAHAKTFPQIVSIAEKFDSKKHVIMAAAKSYQNHVMIIIFK